MSDQYHLYGFPSPDSDFDLRGTYVPPLPEIVGLNVGPETIEKSGIRSGLEWREAESVTLHQALQATCVTPAWLTYDERRRGKLLPGFLADLAVLSTDPFEDLAGCQVVATMTGGRWVHNPPPWE
jgi:imidazolonepropionase-like amidohydrolase